MLDFRSPVLICAKIGVVQCLYKPLFTLGFWRTTTPSAGSKEGFWRLEDILHCQFSMKTAIPDAAASAHLDRAQPA